MTCKKRIINGDFVPPPLAIEMADGNAEAGKAKEVIVEPEPTTMWGKFTKEVGRSLNTDPHASVGVDARTTEVHQNAERFDKNAEAFFTYLQIFSAIFDSCAPATEPITSDAHSPAPSLHRAPSY